MQHTGLFWRGFVIWLKLLWKVSLYHFHRFCKYWFWTRYDIIQIVIARLQKVFNKNQMRLVKKFYISLTHASRINNNLLLHTDNSFAYWWSPLFLLLLLFFKGLLYFHSFKMSLIKISKLYYRQTLEFEEYIFSLKHVIDGQNEWGFSVVRNSISTH